jgi:hypothetical protein
MTREASQQQRRWSTRDERLGNGAQVWTSNPVTTEMLIGKEPVSVDLSSTSDAYFVKEFDRKDAYLKQMNHQPRGLYSLSSRSKMESCSSSHVERW